MELSSPEVIASLLAAQRPRRAPNGKGTSRSAGRCRCGLCTQCLDTAKWERIFKEKFADPDYYSRRTLRHSSSLDGFR